MRIGRGNQQPPAYAGGLLCDAAHQPMSTSKFSHSEFSILAYIYQFTLVVLRSNYKGVGLFKIHFQITVYHDISEPNC